MQPDAAIWTEKFRPKTFEEVKGQQEIVKRVKAFVDKQNMPHMLFAGPAGIGKCVTAETPLLTGDGELKPIKECYDQGVTSVMTLDRKGRIAKGEVAYLYKDASDKLYEIATDAGKRVKATPEHPFLTLKEGIPVWTEASDIREHDYVAVPESVTPTTKEPAMRWEDIPHLWAALVHPQRVRTADLHSGLQRALLEYLERHPQTTITEAARHLGLPRGNVAWAADTLSQRGTITATAKGRTRYLTLTEPITSTTFLPYSLVTDKASIRTVHRHNHRRSKTGLPYFTTLNPEFYEWLGLLYGDGHIHGSSIRFYNTNEALRRRFKNLSRTIFGEGLAIREHHEEEKTPYTEIPHCRLITAILQNRYSLDPHRKKSDIITIPAELFTAPDEHATSFIRGYFETDGHMGRYLEFSSASKRMLEGLTYLLLRWGIHPRLKTKNDQHYLTLHDINQIRRFQETIHPLHKRTVLEREANTNTDVLPLATRHVRNVMGSLGIRHDETAHARRLLDAQRGSRSAVTTFYKELSGRARERMATAIDAINLCTILLKDDLPQNLDTTLTSLHSPVMRRLAGKHSSIRYDRLKEYDDGKRTPDLRNLRRILASLDKIGVRGAATTSKQLSKRLTARKHLLHATRQLGISYADIRRATGSSNTANHLNGDGLSLQTILQTDNLIAKTKSLIERRVFDPELLESLELLDYLSRAQLRWEKVTSTTTLPGEYVYDLNVKETHNFIGGSGPLVLHNTTLSLVVARQFFGDNWQDNFLELNASDERGIDVIRVKVKDFARTRSIGDVPFKIIYLDECDALTKDAQQALRRTMENYTQTCRFILSCNYSSKIIDPIQSRCTVFRFKPLAKEDILEIIDHIATQEKLTINDDAKEALYEVSRGDVRRVENVLQSSAAIQDEITPELIYSIASYARPGEVKTILKHCGEKDFKKAKEQLLKTMLDYGLAGLDVIKQLQQAVWQTQATDRQKLEMSKACGEAEFRMIEGADEFVQLEALLANFILIAQG
ncbi:replication factor C small subunit [Candidatus Woesearchaeota archaeon]|nr:replication factor C small subunit [Candidatus Woesearchaeota archaeon]